MTNDLISEMLTAIRNSSLAKRSFASIRYSKLNAEILKVLKKEGYIQESILENSFSSQPKLRVKLKYKGWWIKKPFFSILKRISRPGKRIFSSYKDFNTKVDGLKQKNGIAIISTSSGIMSHIKATRFKKGGEILCYIG